MGTTDKGVINHFRRFLKNKAGAVALLLFLGLTLWRLILLVYGSEYRSDSNQIWAATYQIVAFWGVVCGFAYARLWGGWKSVVGRANLAFALGLCAQLFGQTVFSIYFYRGIDVPYPSLADVGFFGSIPFYLYGAILLASASGARTSMKSFFSKLQAFLIPLIMLGISYFAFLQGYQFDWTQPVKVFLDLGYPFGQAIYVSAAILAFLLSRKYLGGIMRFAAIMFIISLVAQYIADYTFLYQSSRGTFVGGGIDDYLYLVAYFLMSVSLIQLAVVYKHIKNS